MTKSEWMVASNVFGGRKMYIAYRVIRTDEEDHSGNREYLERGGVPYYRGGYTEDRAAVERFVTETNKEIADYESAR
jgi:hypothetical protein